MQIIKATATLMQDTRRVKKGGVYPVKIRITYNRQQHYYPTGIDVTQEIYTLLMNQETSYKGLAVNKKRELQANVIKLNDKLVKAYKVIENLPDFSFQSFEAAMFTKPIKAIDVYSIYNTVIDKLKGIGRLGTASNYTCSMNSLIKYKAKLNFREITTDFLNGYENSLLTDGKSISTVGIYLRPLRAIYNLAIEDGLITKENYPFTKRRYQIPASKNTKKALTAEEVGRIYYFETVPGTWWQKAKDIWMFSYLANGINMKDIAMLKHDNIDGDFIRFIRAKTTNSTRANQKQISIFLTSQLLEIIGRLKTNYTTKGYLFPVLEEGQNANRQRSLITQFTKMVNNYIGKIAKEVAIEKHVTTYTARHSFATILKRGGLSIEKISESLGHQSLKTTSCYLDSFDNETKKEIGNLLLQF